MKRVIRMSILIPLLLTACGGGGGSTGGVLDDGSGGDDGGSDGGGNGGGGNVDGGGDGGSDQIVTGSCDSINAPGADSDNDGLTDCYEKFIGTSPADADSDGDQLSDYEEVVNRSFDPSINNFQFNPRIADIPYITVELQTPPDITVSFTTSQNQSVTSGVTRTSESASTVTSTQSYEESLGEELSSTIGSTGGTSGFDISSSITYSQSYQETMGWSKQQSNENRRSVAKMEEQTSATGVSQTHGDMSVLLKVKNRGFQTVTLQSLTLTALEVDPQDPTTQRLVAGLDYDTSTGSFPSFELAPNSRSNNLPFTAELNLGRTLELLRDSRNLILQPTTWRVVDRNGLAFTHNLTDVLAKSAQVIIDYGPGSGREIERHYVATVSDFGENRITVEKALSEILRVPYVVDDSAGGNQGLTSVRGIRANSEKNGRWLVVHNFADTDGFSRVKRSYDSRNGSYDFNTLQLAQNEVLHLLYIEDADRDGIGSREEFVHGTSDTMADSDGDGLSDFDEIKVGWKIPVTATMDRTVFSDPTRQDVDNDGVLDGDERSKGTHPYKVDTDNDGILDFNDTRLTRLDMQEVAYLPLEKNQIVDAEISNSTVSTGGSFSFANDRFGNALSAASFSQDAEQLDIFDVYTASPKNGASLVLWMKVDPNLPTTGWVLYEHRAPEQSPDQFFWMFKSNPALPAAGDGFQIFGDPYDRHSFFPIHNNLFTDLPFAQWHMMVMVAAEAVTGEGMTDFTVYYDGELMGTRSTAGTFNNAVLVEFLTNPWYFAGESTLIPGLGQFHGAIDDIRFFKRSLDAGEVDMLYQAEQ